MTEDIYKLAEEYYKNAEYEEALKLYSIIAKSEPSKISPLISMGNCYDFIGEKELAIASYKKAYKLNKKMHIPLSNLAIVYYDLKDFKMAEKYANQSLKVKNKNISPLIILGNICYQEKKFYKALEHYFKALDINDSHYTSCINISNTYFELKEVSLAIEYAEKAVSISPNALSAYCALGNLYMNECLYDKALYNLNKAYELDDKDAWCHNYLSQIYQKKGDCKKAFEFAYKAIELTNGDNNHHINLGYMLYELLHLEKELCFEYANKWLLEYSSNDIVKHMGNSIIKEDKLSRANDEYLKSIFDVFAGDFEDVLAGLNYKAPELINAFLVDIYGAKPSKKLKILDAGCGTGLCGKYLKKYSKFFGLSGVDISKQMIREARKKKIYNSLFIDEIVGFLSKQNKKYDLIVSSDVFTYFGDLEELFFSINNALTKNGRAIFTISENLENDEVFLHSSGRFLHARKYIEIIIKNANFKLEKISREHLRNEADKAVYGFVVSMVKN